MRWERKANVSFLFPPDFVVIVVVALAGMAATPIFTGLCRNRIIFDPHRPYQPSRVRPGDIGNTLYRLHR